MSIPNIQDYQDKVVKKLISLQKIDENNVAIGTRKFDPVDGTELPNEVVGVTLVEVDKAIADKLKEVDDLKAFKADLVAAV